MINSKQKGARSERDAAKFLREQGREARRGQQYKGSPDSEDIIHNVPRIYFEVKNRERLNLYEAYEQAVRDSPPDKFPVVLHKKNRKIWLVTLSAVDFINSFRPKLGSDPHK